MAMMYIIILYTHTHTHMIMVLLVWSWLIIILLLHHWLAFIALLLPFVIGYDAYFHYEE